MRWRLILEEYGPELRYIKGENNIVADALSRLEMTEEKEDKSVEIKEELASLMQDVHARDLELAELFADDVRDFPKDYPLSYAEVRYEQGKDKYIQDCLKRTDLTPKYEKRVLAQAGKDYELVVRENRIVLPTTLAKRAVEWYHTTLCHPGETRTELTMAQHYCWKGMKNTIKQVCSRCPTCQLTKKTSQKLGHLTPKKAEIRPWETLCIDLIGPYKIGVVDEECSGKSMDSPPKKRKGRAPKPKKRELTLHCLTMIDPATGLF